MIVIAGAFAYAKVTHPDLRIIPVVLGIAGFILGPMLGVFLIGMFTERRGSDAGNMHRDLGRACSPRSSPASSTS